MTIGMAIRQLRQEQDITQEQLAEALGITSRAVSQWENGRTAPDISQLPALANFFNVTTDRLLGVDIKCKKEEVRKILKQVHIRLMIVYIISLPTPRMIIAKYLMATCALKSL